jgi:small subunit ribosomal protein S9
MAEKQYRGTGRRKTAVARVIITPGKGLFQINGRSAEEYFPGEFTRQQAAAPLAVTQMTGRLDIRVNVSGGGQSGQAGAVRHGLARALVNYDEGNRPALKQAGFLTRDPRKVERKKYGLHKARKAPQYSKR